MGSAVSTMTRTNKGRLLTGDRLLWGSPRLSSLSPTSTRRMGHCRPPPPLPPGWLTKPCLSYPYAPFFGSYASYPSRLLPSCSILTLSQAPTRSRHHRSLRPDSPAPSWPRPGTLDISRSLPRGKLLPRRKSPRSAPRYQGLHAWFLSATKPDVGRGPRTGKGADTIEHLQPR